MANYQSNIHHYLDDIPGLKLRLGRQPMEALKEAPSCKPAEGLKKAPKAPLESYYLGEETLSEAQKMSVNLIREPFQQTKFGPQPVSIAHCVKSMPGATALAPV